MMTAVDGGVGPNSGGAAFTASFCAGAGASAGGIGYQEEIAPTLKGSPSGNMMPTVLCLNDQGGQIMEVSENVTGTLRAQTDGAPTQTQRSGLRGGRSRSETSELSPLGGSEGCGACGNDGHQPLVLYDSYGIDARYTGPHEVAPTLSARAGTGGGNLPIVEDRTFARSRVDCFIESETASALSARQYKDAIDLVGQHVETSHDGGENPFCYRCAHRSECGPKRIMLLRRLMPVECEKLMGYPPGWTELPQAKDSPRYRSLGNSVVIPCVDHLMQCAALAILADR